MPRWPPAKVDTNAHHQPVNYIIQTFRKEHRGCKKVGFCVLCIYLQCTDGSALETQVSFEVLGDFSNQTLEGQLADQQLSGLLIPTDLTQGHCTGPRDHINICILQLPLQ